VIWTLISYVGIACVLAVLVGAVWMLRRQSRLYPPGTHVGDADEERKPEMRWIGWIYGGGHG
jgi:hypothetical protein